MEPMSTNGTPVRERVIAMILSGTALILLIFIGQILVTLEREVSGLRESADQAGLANLVHLRAPDPAMAKLEGTCTDCHLRRRSSRPTGSPGRTGRFARMSGLSVPTSGRTRCRQ
jgi:hypothetical protein